MISCSMTISYEAENDEQVKTFEDHILKELRECTVVNVRGVSLEHG